MQREEIKNKDRLIASKNKEIIALGEKLSRIQSERDTLQDNVQRYKQGDSFSKMSPKSPSMGIGDKSFEEVTAATITHKVYSEHEKELILKNSELSFRLREVEKQYLILKEAKGSLVRSQLYLIYNIYMCYYKLLCVTVNCYTGTYSG